MTAFDQPALPAPALPGALLATLIPGAGRQGCLGLLGGGQLGRMLVHAAQAHGLRVCVLEPDAASPAAAAADHHLCAAYTDPSALASLAAVCAAVTTEFENVPADVLAHLAGSVVVSPPAAAVAICQDRALEKACFTASRVPCAPHALVAAQADVDRLVSGDSGAATSVAWPAILKTARLGYDGKGQCGVAHADALGRAWAQLGAVPCVLEQRLPLARELSVIVARGRDGACVHLPVQHNRHRDGVLALTEVPAAHEADAADVAAQQAIASAHALAQALAYVGVLCVEFFVLQDGRLVANEMAPRPHNSGHWSIDGCDVSQFDLQLRTLAGWPLTAPRQHSAAVMLNLLGDLWRGPERVAPDWAALLALPGLHLHLYGKAEAKAGRKMGHLTVTAATLAEARATAMQAAAQLGLPAV